MSAPLACTRCSAPFVPVGANHTHDGMCGGCQPCDMCGHAKSEHHEEDREIWGAICRDECACSDFEVQCDGCLSTTKPEARDAADVLGKGTT